MSLILHGRSAWARWSAWSLFWAGFVSLGMMQAWVFGNHSEKPALADVVGPMHFWFPSVLFIAPIWWLEQVVDGLVPSASFWFYSAALVVWPMVPARLTVWLQDRLYPEYSAAVTGWVLGVSVATIFVLRLIALLPSIGENLIGTVSFTVLSGLVIVYYAHVAIGLVMLLSRRVRGRRDPI